MLNRFFEQNSCALLICQNDCHSTILEANDAFYQLVGYSREEMHSLHHNRFSNLVFDDLSEILTKVDHALEKQKSLDYEYRIYHKNGHLIWIHDIATYDPQKDVFYVVIMDISNRQTELETVKNIAVKDSLTGLYNRGYIEENFSAIMNKYQDRPYAVMMLDLDNFKLLNDCFGHQVGDELLKVVSNKLTTVFDSEDIIARLGGDEFMIVMPNVESEQALSCIIEQISQQLVFAMRHVEVSASAGVFYSINRQRSFSYVYQKSDTVLYIVKNNGKKNFKIHVDPCES